jgi:kynurenine 3-monooxygenase
MPKFDIAGAGLVGSLMALMLKKQGHEVALYEKRSDMRKASDLGGRSINLIITSRGLHALSQVGIDKEILKLTVPVYGRMIHNRDGSTLYQPYGREGDCNYSVSRAELNRALMTLAENSGVSIHFDHNLKSMDTSKREASFSTTSGDKTIHYRHFIGADGVGSPAREAVARATNGVSVTEMLASDYKELTMPLGRDGKPQMQMDALHIWPRGTHMLMALPNLDGSFTMTLYMPKSGAFPSFETVKSETDIVRLFESEFKDAIAMMPDYLKEYLENPQGILGTVRAFPWQVKDEVVLVGDAAHGIVPFFGQGMNSGFEDCVELVEKLQKYPSDFTSAFALYFQNRKPNTDAIAAMALENFIEMRDKVGDPRFQLKKKIEAKIEATYPDLYRSRYGLITYTLVPYAKAREIGVRQEAMLEELSRGVSSVEEMGSIGEEMREWIQKVCQ